MKLKRCPMCRGNGTVVIGSTGTNSFYGMMQITCPYCNGAGDIWIRPGATTAQ